MIAADPVHPGAARELWPGPIIDADVHINTSVAAIEPHLGPVWQDFIQERGFGSLGEPAGNFRVYPPQAPSSAKAEWVPADGTAPASTLALLREHILDGGAVEYAIANCYMGIDSIRHPDFAAGLASAVNDWVIANWLDQDPRLRASLVVPARSPEAAAREIDRVGGHPGFVQVLMPVRSDRLYGNRCWHPTLAAMTRHDLVFGLHWGGTSDGPPTSTGFPNYYVADYVGEVAVYWAQITSLIGEGAFAEFPDLRVSVLEGGFAWLPSFAWRLDKEWRGLRRDVPWVQAAPTEIIRDRMRFSVGPIDGGSAEDLEATLRWIGSDDLLMFATDYPHWHDDDLAALLAAMPEAARAKLMAENARAWYRL